MIGGGDGSGDGGGRGSNGYVDELVMAVMLVMVVLDCRVDRVLWV